MKGVVMAALAALAAGGAAQGYEGQRANSVLLNGPWERAVGDGGEGAETPAGQARLKWVKVDLPGQLMRGGNRELSRTLKFVWVRRRFKVSKVQAGSLAVLRWNRISLGATAFINGAKVGANEPTGPYQVILPPGVLKPGENRIVLKVCGAGGVRKSASGYFLFGSGFSTCHQRGMPAITDDVWIDFATDAYVKWALAMPDLKASKVRIRVTPVGPKALDGLTISAAVRPWPKGRTIGRGEAAARVRPTGDPLGGEHFFVDVALPNFKPWTYEHRNLYVAELKFTRGGQVLDELAFRFGMREITVEGGNYKLNGRDLWLRGSNLVFEWDWGDTITGREIDYLVTEAREMSMNCFRTHTQPPPRLWADIGDEHGTMILAETPLLYNYRNYRYTPAEYEIFHRNSLTDAAGWMARLWNHPSVVMWVLSNESRNDNRWERGPYQRLVNALDPTRPTMRTGTDGTKENYDVHTCGNITRELSEGSLQLRIGGWFKAARGRTVTNSEYMNHFKRSPIQWTGTANRIADAVAVAQIGAEHTEAMRRARLDCILPYMYAGWTRTRRSAPGARGPAVWKANFAAPNSAAWHSSLSGILASLDLFDADYLTGQAVETDLALINDTWHDAKIRVDLLITTDNPELIPEAACFKKPVAKWSYDYTLEADSLRRDTVIWAAPAEQGSYWLTARTTGIGGRAVLSQRFIRAIRPPEVPAKVKSRSIVVLGGDRRSAAWFKSRGLKAAGALPKPLDPKTHVVLIWNAANVKPAVKAAAGKRLCAFAGGGGTVAVLAAGRKWGWRSLCDVELENVSGSRVFMHGGAKHPALAGIGRDWLVRWNGLPGTVAAGSIKVAAKARKLLWVRDKDTTVMAELPAATGRGTILFSRLAIRHRVDPASKTYDPVAEKILLNILARPTHAEGRGGM